MKSSSKKLVALLGSVGLLVVVTIWYAAGAEILYFWRVFFGIHVQSSISPTGTYSADLWIKPNLADFNFVVKVDGKRVYISPDHCRNDYDEKLVWGRSGEQVTLVLKGRRVFAYNARTKTPLGKGELADFDLVPSSEPLDSDCGYPTDIEE